MVVTNLYDGIDWYSLRGSNYERTFFVRTTFDMSNKDNGKVPIMYVQAGFLVLVGSSGGSVRLFNAQTGDLAQTLEHEGVSRSYTVAILNSANAIKPRRHDSSDCAKHV